MARDYRDDYPLSDTIAEAYRDGMNYGASRGGNENTDDRDYAMQRADTIEQALEAIHAALDGIEWSPDTLDTIASIIMSTGRTIAPPS